MRRGLVELDGEGEAVGGIVVMRWGENALAVIDAVKERLESVRAGLPEGVEIVTTYDRSELIRAAIATLRNTLLEEMLVVSIVILVFLLHARSALIPILTIPIGIALAFVPMLYQGLNANIMSLGGIAVAIGAMVDAAIIVVENVHKKLEAWEAAGRPGERADVILRAMQEVGPSIFFALLVITVSFLPIFALEGTEGRLFKPLAFTKTYAMGFAAVLSVTLTPALAALLIRGRIRGEHANPINRWLVQRLRAGGSLRGAPPRARRGRGALVLLATAVPAFLSLGSEFMPPLNEGTLLYMPTAPPGISIGEASRILQLHGPRAARGARGRARVRQDRPRRYADRSRAALDGRDGRAARAARAVAAGPRPGTRWSQELDQKLRYPGMPNLWWMPIQTRTEMLATGVRSQLGVKVFGDDLAQVEQAAIAIAEALQGRARHAQRVRRARHGRLLPRRAHRPRARRALRRAGRGREHGARGGDRRHDRVADRRGARALRDPGALCAELPRRPGGGRSDADPDRQRRPRPAARARGSRVHDRPRHGAQRGREARRARGRRRRRSADRRLRERSAPASSRSA